MCKRFERHFDSRPESVPEARHLVERTLNEWGMDEQDPARARLDDVLLVATELTANAAKSGSEGFVLTVDVHRDHVKVAVLDDDPAPARQQNPHLEPSGRGLRIVQALSTEWGQTAHDGMTKTVWSRMELPNRSALARCCRL